MIDRLRGAPLAAAVVVGAAVAAVARSTHGRHVGDNRFDQYVAPGWRLARETSLWDGTRGMGRVGEELWPLTAPLALLRGLGLSPAATQQVWHAAVLAIAGLGVIALLRTVQPRVGATHLVAALAYAFSPFAITFLLPTNLFWSFALAPWLLAAARKGLVGDQPWRWAAVFALLVATGGDTDPPSLLFAALWTVPVAAHAVWVERSVSVRRAGAWFGRAALLTLWVDLAALVKVRLGAGPLAQRLLTTEGVAEVNQTSSWSESWRGLGYWVTYFQGAQQGGDVPGATAWFETPAGVLLTFVVPVVALVALGRMRWRPRLAWAAVALVSVAVMVGSNPTPSRSPAGRLLLAAYDAVPSLASFRTTYKAGSGLTLAVAVLAATGASAWGTALAARDRRLRSVPLAALAVVVVAAAVPLWSGRLYDERNEMEAVAPHWVEAAAWVEDQPGDARVLVLPGSTQTAYRWGWAGDDILDALFRRHPNVVPTNFPVSTPLTADIVDALGRRLAEGRLDARELAAVARRLGVGWVLVRNDLDWDRIDVPRPADLDPLRGSDDLPLVETFGAPGRDTTDPDDDSRPARAEAELPPIEVFAVPGVAGSRLLTRSADPPLLVDGGGDAWPILAELGLLDGDRPLGFTGTRDDDELAALLAAGSPLVVTDTNRRRLTLVRGPGPTSSEVLPVEGDPGPVAPADLFDRPGTQTVARYGDVASFAQADDDGDLVGFSPWYRPAHAFDGDLGTSWRTGAQVEDPSGAAVTATLARPHAVASMAIVPLQPSGRLRRVTAVDVVLDGRSRRVELEPAGATEVTWDQPVEATEVEVRIAAVEGDGNAAVGLVDVTIEGLDARERIALPTRLTGTADDALRAALAEAPVAYVMTRSGLGRTVDGERDDEEETTRRSFGVVGDRTFALTGSVQGGRRLPDRTVDALLGGPVGAWGTSRPVLPSEGRGGLALDGDPSTGWVGRAGPAESLTVRFPAQDVATVSVRVGAGPSDVPLDEVDVTVGPRTTTLALAPEPGCTTACDRVGTATVDAGEHDRVVIEAHADTPGSRRVRVLEVEVDGADGPVPRVEEPGATDVCGTGLVNVDGEGVPVRVTGADPSDALDDATVPVEGCAPIALADGEHTLDSLGDARLDTVVLATDGALDVPSAPAPPARAEDREPGRLTAAVEGREPGVVLTGMSYDAGWRATLAGDDLGAPVEVDGQAAWVVPEGPDRRVTMTFRPQRTFRTALFVSLVGAAVCLALAVRPRARRYARPDAPEPA